MNKKKPNKAADKYSFESPESSQVAGASYNKETETLRIIFRNRLDPSLGQLYEYTGVPESVWKGLVEAPSKGHYVNTEIVVSRALPKYKGVRIG